jgi:hypothetical protein
LKSPTVISTEATQSVAKWRNLLKKQISRFTFGSLEMTFSILFKRAYSQVNTSPIKQKALPQRKCFTFFFAFLRGHYPDQVQRVIRSLRISQPQQG